ncbi:uncharacterized protein LOC109717766 [Ananas comosus]|uniref:Uncharacterized protein LOC109717766 n=1 Tax=Ananas comosus TaxID=4615 RepID=A0A6P5G0I9_ANACO|nr:uncharacterized protein LOC109717766 [Ananas comosus]
MGNCVACLISHEPKRPKSRSHGCVVPLNQIYGPDDCSVKEDGRAKGVTRIKMVMTKKEAAQLLSKLSADRIVERVKRELDRSKGCRLRAACRDPWRPALESIPEN